MMPQKNIVLIFAAIILVYCCSIGIDTMDVDASQYAGISREMKETGSYLQVFEQGKDYLDKPPFLFWISSLSMQLFGENNLGFKLPSILFALIAIFATYRFAKLFYSQRIALLSAIVFASYQALFLITNDVRTDTILMSWVIIAIWQIAEWIKHEKTIHFILGAAAIGAGMVTKGPIALFVPIFAFGSHFLLQRKFNYLFKPVYLLGILVIALVLVPMSIGLYQQFDLHPEKTVNGLTHVSGLRFFYWTQSFGRITGENVWNNHASFSFLFENLLWGLLPWTLFFIAGLVNEIIKLFKSKLLVAPSDEFITTGGFVLTYCSLAISKYQLPHYIYVVLPLIAIITAKMVDALFFEQTMNWLKKIMSPVQWLVCIVLLEAPVFILIVAFPSQNSWPWLIPAAMLIFAIALLIRKGISQKLLYLSLGLAIGLNLFLSLWFYPQVLQYQASNNAGRFIRAQKIEKGKIVLFQFPGNSTAIHFYSRQIIQKINAVNELKAGTYVMTMDEGLATLKAAGKLYTIIKTGPDFHVTALNGKFLNKDTRDQQTKPYYILLLQP